MSLRDILGDTPQIKILECLYNTQLMDLCQLDIATDIGMTRQTVAKCLKGLVNNNIVVISRRFGHTKLYRINCSTRLVKALIPYMSRVSNWRVENGIQRKI